MPVNFIPLNSSLGGHLDPPSQGIRNIIMSLLN
jgi:hypothetical protein